MGSAKRHRAQNNFRARATRSSKSRLLSDPSQTTQELTSQLRALGLYAAPTLGDGNCLFRALSDQYYGSPSRHTEVRRDICDWIEKHPERYEGFVDEDEFGGDSGGKNKLQVYLRRMRQNATYGGHMELSAFAHLTHRNIKVVQPGLVYIIQCDPSLPSPDPNDGMEVDESDDDDGLSGREKRKLRKERMRAAKDRPGIDEDPDPDEPPIYVAYHDWEHFSSIRSLRGPHTGLPNVRESASAPLSSDSRSSSQRAPKIKLKLSTPKESTEKPRSRSKPPDPTNVPLPPSRSHSPSPFPTGAPASAVPSGFATLDVPRLGGRSPKRSFDESSETSGSSQSSSASKRSRTMSTLPDSQDSTPYPKPNTSPLTSESESGDEDDGEEDSSPARTTPFLSPASSSASLSTSSLSSLSPSPEPEDRLPAPSPPPQLTKRQRKRLGLPKPQPSAGKIVIPGGRYLRSRAGEVSVKQEEADDTNSEWKRNGSGRVDVRGFRELKI